MGRAGKGLRGLVALGAFAWGSLIAQGADAATLYISEFANGLAQVGSTQPQIFPQAAITDQAITISGTSAQSAKFNARTHAIMVVCDEGCSIVVGTNPTATTGNYLLFKGIRAQFGVAPGQVIAVIANSAGG